jgi:hypothetical protein
MACIKLDVEGAESNVLRGSSELLARNPQAFLLFEVSGGNRERISVSLETLRLLEDRGYRFRRISVDGLEPPATAKELLPRLQSSTWQQALFNVIAAR